MKRKLSRRDFGRHAVGAITVLAVPAVLNAQPPTKPEAPLVTEDALAAIEAQLANPLSPEVQKLLREAVTNSRNTSSNRRKFVLPENSEPCFATLTFPATRTHP